MSGREHASDSRDEYAKLRSGRLEISPGNSVLLDAEPPIGPWQSGRHLIGSGWRWYQYGKLWGPPCRTQSGCRLSHWWRAGRFPYPEDDAEERA